MKDNEQEIDTLPTVEEVRQHVMQQLQDRYMSFQEHIAREEAVKVSRLSTELRDAKAILELRGIRIKYLAQQNSTLQDENLVLRDALELVRGFLINKGYSEHDPFVLGAVNKALEKQIPEGDVE